MNPGSSRALRVAGGWPTTRDAEHAYARAVAERRAFAATSFVTGAQVVLDLADTAEVLADRARLFVFPGHEQLTGTLSVAKLLASSAIEEVRGVANWPVAMTDVVWTQNFVRPTLETGRVVLVVRPFDDGSDRPERASLVPFEQPHPTPCCADHG